MAFLPIMARRSLSRLLLPLALLAGGVPGPACSATPSVPAGRSAGRPVILVGLDGADWSAIGPLAKAGRLPAFSRLMSSGRTGVLVATPPLVSPIIWTTIATGRPPDEHGILDFMVDLPSGHQAPVTSAHRRVPALWNLFSEAGRSVGVVGWWATWPAETVRGTLVTDRVAPQLAAPGQPLDGQTIFPREAAPRLSARIVRPADLTYEDLRRYVPLSRDEYDTARKTRDVSVARLYEDRLTHLAIVAASTRTYTGMAEAILEAGQPQLLAVYLEGIDTLSHLFVKDPARGPSAIEAAYRDADGLIARLARASSADTIIVVCSDHGFHGPEAASLIKDDPALLTGPATAWHRPYGIVAAIEAGRLVGGRETAGDGTSVGTVTPMDIAPTILHLAGLPVATEMEGRVVTALLPPDAASRTIERRDSPHASPRPRERDEAPGADDALVARLQSLGYVGAQPSSLAKQNLGEILYRGGRFAAAERQLQAVVEAQPSNLSAHLWLAKALSAQGRQKEALRVYERALKLPGAITEALVEAVSLAVSSGEKQEARALLGSLKVTGPEVHTARAELARSDGQAKAAERELRSALSLDPLSFDALSRLLDLLITAGRPREALPALQRAAQLAPGSPRHAALLGEALLAAGDAAAAAPALQQALDLAPDASPVRIDLGRAFVAQKKWREAEAVITSASPSREREILLGVVCSSQARFAEAYTHFESALKSGKPTPDLLNGLGWAQHKLGREAQAADWLRQSLALKEDQPDIQRLLAQIEGRAAR